MGLDDNGESFDCLSASKGGRSSSIVRVVNCSCIAANRQYRKHWINLVGQ
jgi:hypothetical protein